MGARILIIEDNPANLELMSYLLTAFGHRTITASNGADGLESAERERPDLINLRYRDSGDKWSRGGQTIEE